jgi:hypothetical protein
MKNCARPTIKNQASQIGLLKPGANPTTSKVKTTTTEL